ncbi:hypothetical protein F2P45_33560 [Massilia sp. CCM 8733]|uniref:Uncharacterized protein n=1 Tax=Massilia mucilaginosa TaxID=2609282 RepID=A0ABX0P3J2_9BURK|nr:hypothetical protein [Massilia mucilaginosa]NHZ93888.1 hypothetical protein [Massilia mucilaginosa]
MDVKKLIDQEEFFYADCIAINSCELIGFEINGNKIEFNNKVIVDTSDLTYIFKNFSVDIAGSTYAGGEGASHGSCGFFYKKTDGYLDWILISTESNPFVRVEIIDNDARFSTSSGATWIIPNNNIQAVYIETN